MPDFSRFATDNHIEISIYNNIHISSTTPSRDAPRHLNIKSISRDCTTHLRADTYYTTHRPVSRSTFSMPAAKQMQKTRLAATTTKTAITQKQSLEIVQTLLHGGACVPHGSTLISC